jgi:hypothetical protein
VVFRSLLGISWMWFFGAVFLSQFPSFAKEVLHGNEQVASLLLVVFSVGIGIGSLLCETLSRRQVEIGLVPLGAIGMTRVRDRPVLRLARPAGGPEMGLGAFLAQSAHWRVMADLALLSLFAGLYSVPMYALIQLRSAAHAPGPHHRRQQHPQRAVHDRQLGDRRRAARRRLHHPADLPVHRHRQRAGGGFYIFLLVPEYLLRFVAWVLSRFVYRFRSRRRAHPDRGPGRAGVQPRELRRRGAADGGQPAADLLHDGPPHLPRAGAGLAVQAGQGDPDRAAEGRSGRL